MGKATRAGSSVAPPESTVDTTAQVPVPQSVQDLDEADEILEQTNTPGEPLPEPPKRNASQPAWAEFAAAQGLEDADDMSRDELVAWWDEQQETPDEG